MCHVIAQATGTIDVRGPIVHLAIPFRPSQAAGVGDMHRAVRPTGGPRAFNKVAPQEPQQKTTSSKH